MVGIDVVVALASKTNLNEVSYSNNAITYCYVVERSEIQSGKAEENIQARPEGD